MLTTRKETQEGKFYSFAFILFDVRISFQKLKKLCISQVCPQIFKSALVYNSSLLWRARWNQKTLIRRLSVALRLSGASTRDERYGTTHVGTWGA